MYETVHIERVRKFFGRLAAGLLDRVPSAWGIPLVVIIGALIWLGVLKLFGL